MVIDIHTHVYPRRYLDRLRECTGVPRVEVVDGGESLVIFADEEKAAGGARPMGEEYFVLERKLSYMDQNGIDTSVISVGNPWVDFLEPGEATWWAASLNEEVEEICSKNGRLYGMGVVPLQDVKAACLELVHVKNLPHLCGVVIGTRPGHLHLDDPVLNPFWEQAEALQIPVFVHPHYTVGADWMGGYGHAMLLALGFTFETTTAVTRLILGGVMERYAGLSLILAHSGGTLPFLAGRLDACTRVDKNASRNLRKPFSEYLRQLYYDALIYHGPGLLCAQELVGTDRLLFGTDHPFGIADPQSCYKAIRQVAPSPEAAALISSGNARRLLGI